MYTAQTALFKTLNLFPPEKQLVQVRCLPCCAALPAMCTSQTCHRCPTQLVIVGAVAWAPVPRYASAMIHSCAFARVQTERAKGSYGVLPYFASKVLAELPTLALYPLVHAAIIYPMTGLQPGVRSPRRSMLAVLAHPLCSGLADDIGLSVTLGCGCGAAGLARAGWLAL